MNNLSWSSTQVSRGVCTYISEDTLKERELTEEGKGIYLIKDIFDDSWNHQHPDEACICEWMGQELALGWTVEWEDSYILFRSDLRNPGSKIILYIKKSDNNKERFEELKTKYLHPLFYMTDTENRREIFPIEWARNYSVNELEEKVGIMLCSHPETWECFTTCLYDEKGLSIIRKICTGVNEVLDKVPEKS